MNEVLNGLDFLYVYIDDLNVLNFPRPKTTKKLRRFLGTINFNKIGIPKAAEVQAPLSDLLRENIEGKAPIQWNLKALEAFEKMQQKPR